MKGPMTTQTLRGLRNAGAMHWRGDRATGFFGSDPLDANLSFNNFIVAFEGLLGRDGLPSAADMQTLHRLPAASAAAAESGAQSQQLAQRRPATRPQLLRRRAAVGRHRHSHPRRLDSGRYRVQLRRLPSPRSRAGLLRHRRRSELRGHHADREDPAPAQHVSEGRHVRRAQGELLRRAGYRQHGRSDPRLRLRATTARSTRCSASSPRSCSTRS